MQTRLQAQRLLVERGNKDVVPALVELAKDQSVDAIGLNTAAIHALGTLAGLKAVEGDALAAAVAGLKHPSAGVRRNALKVLPPTAESLAAITASGVLNDADVQVRLAALLALADLPASDSAAAVAIKALADSSIQQDRHLLDATTSALAKNGPAALVAATKSTNQALANAAAADRLVIVADHVARTGLDNVASVIEGLTSSQPEIATAVLTGLARGWPRDKQVTLSPELETTIRDLFVKLPPGGKSQLVTLATRWGSTGLQEQIAKLAAGFLADASNTQLGDVARIAAASRYVDINRSTAEAGKLLALINPRTSPELARGLVEALGKSESSQVGSALAEALPKLTPAVRPAALTALLSKSTWTLALLTAIEQGKVQLADLSLDQKQALASHPDRQLANRARRMLEAGGSLPNPDRQKVLDELMPLTKQTGDPVAGKLVFKNQCAKCHTHSGEGTKIGPDLTGQAVHPKHELLVHLIDPSRSVEGNYRVYAVLTADGVVINGLLASETKTAIELIDSEAKKHVVLREDIENLQASAKSLMPEGFEKQVKPEELSNLLEFLTQRGQYVPLPLDKVATVVTTKGMFFDESSTTERLNFADWGPKTFEGVPFTLVDPKVNTIPNAILLYGPEGRTAPTMPRSVSIPCAIPAKAIHLLSGISGWGYPYSQQKSTTMIVRLHYADGQTEDHKLLNGEHFADYIRRVDVPQSKFAFNLSGGKQLRFLSVIPQRAESLAKIEFVKGDDRTAPVVMAVTVETK